jgi:hypothetical protein
MGFRTTVLASFWVTLLFGLAFLLAPEFTMAGYRVGLNLGPTDAQHANLARSLGVALLLCAGLCWALNELRDADVQRKVALAMTLVTAAGAVAALYAVLIGAVNALGWSTVGFYAFFALMWGRIALRARGGLALG